mgnify:CR=1 FL=1
MSGFKAQKVTFVTQKSYPQRAVNNFPSKNFAFRKKRR